ncbi:MAG: acyltransferase family protein [Eubacteriales bacterium]|nr:acyltransferase family protein [Eubacteriales bacterium]
MTETKRIAKWDNIRLFLMFCVVLGHIINYVELDTDTMNSVYLFIYAFHMPAFIFLSGLFAKRAVRSFRYDKAFTFLALYFVIKFSLFLTRVALSREAAFKLLSTIGVDWYAFVLFLFYLVTMFLQRFDRRYVLLATLFFGCMAGYDLTLGGRMALARACSFYPFFVLGFALEQETVLKVSRKLWAKLTAAVILIAAGIVAAQCYDELEWLLPILKGFSYRNLEEDLFEYGALYRLGSYAVAFLMIFAVIVLIPSFRGFWSKLGSRTMSIYAFHYCLIMIICSGLVIDKHHMKFILARRMSETQADLWMVGIALLITVVLALRPFDWLVRLFTVPPLAKPRTADAEPAEEAQATVRIPALPEEELEHTQPIPNVTEESE